MKTVGQNSTRVEKSQYVWKKEIETDGNKLVSAIYEQNISKQPYERVKDKDSG